MIILVFSWKLDEETRALKYKIKTNGLFPVTLVIEAFGFEPTDYIVKSIKQKVRIEIGDNTTLLDGVEIQKINISSKQKESALTVESMSLMAIKECPAADFYEGLGALKGVDLTSASIGFKVINTRGFNSTSPVRSLQIIDGVDNQAPGLNFSLGNSGVKCSNDTLSLTTFGLNPLIFDTLIRGKYFSPSLGGLT